MISKTKIKQRAQKKGNLAMKELVGTLKKGNKFWIEVSYELTRPSRQMASVSLGKLNEMTKEGETVLVPGKVLSDGEIDHKIIIGAYGFSKAALNKLKGSKIVGIDEMFKSNKDGKGIKILK